VLGEWTVKTELVNEVAEAAPPRPLEMRGLDARKQIQYRHVHRCLSELVGLLDKGRASHAVSAVPLEKRLLCRGVVGGQQDTMVRVLVYEPKKCLVRGVLPVAEGVGGMVRAPDMHRHHRLWITQTRP